MNHLAYYHLEQEPFAVMPLTQFYFHSEQHDQAFVRLKRVAEGMKGLGVCVGNVGTGKSLLARRLLESLPDDAYEVALLVVLHGDVDSAWLVRRIAAQFGVEVGTQSKVEIISELYRKLEAIATSGKRAVILLDEAHMLRGQDLLEEIRGLLNLELPDRKLLSLILFGLPELDDVLSRDAALAHRTAVRCSLKPFPPEVVADYVRFRIEHAGSNEEVFSDEALERVARYSSGNPRVMNVICDNALFEGFVRRASLPLPADIIESVAEDLRLRLDSSQR
ncbi:MAG: AAA family ATPase [Deltaproteobacteria bacterium]|nr:AAA family ATPase [Deltaproteobacteria bacterium]